MRVAPLAAALALVLALASIGNAATMEIFVRPEGDAVAGNERAGYGSPWYQLAPDATANPNAVYHWYSDGSGAGRWTFLQFDLSDLAGMADAVTAATFNFNLLPDGWGEGTRGNLNHLSNAAAANGQATQGLGGDQPVGSVTAATILGWNYFDVTQFIKADLAAGYAWSVFSFNNVGYAGMFFSSGETDQRSYLQVTYNGGNVDPNLPTPEPSSVVLMLLGAAGLFTLRRKGVM